jgi:hypothetical protein
MPGKTPRSSAHAAASRWVTTSKPPGGNAIGDATTQLTDIGLRSDLTLNDYSFGQTMISASPETPGAYHRGVLPGKLVKPDPSKYAKEKAYWRKVVEERDEQELKENENKNNKKQKRVKSSDIEANSWNGAMYKAHLKAVEESEEKSAKAIVDFVNAITGVKKLTKGKYQEAYNLAKTQLDFKKGGLLNKSKNGEETAYEKFKDLPDVLKAAKAHKAYIKEKASQEKQEQQVK